MKGRRRCTAGSLPISQAKGQSILYACSTLWGLMRISPFYIIFLKNVTIQNPIRKTVANATKFTHVVTSPYKLCQMSLRMHAFDVHIVIICMALNSYKKS